MNGYYNFVCRLLTAPHDTRRKYKTSERLIKNVIKLV